MSTATAQLEFCQLASDATETCKPIGAWFDELFLNRNDWETVSEEDYERINAAEDYITHRLCEAIGLPQRRTSYTNSELAQAVPSETQAEIWQAMLVKYGEAEHDCTTTCIECGKPDGRPAYKGLCWRCKLGDLADALDQ
jgi:hypothetical protein